MVTFVLNNLTESDLSELQMALRSMIGYWFFAFVCYFQNIGADQLSFAFNFRCIHLISDNLLINLNYEKVLMVCPGFNSRKAEWNAQTN